MCDEFAKIMHDEFKMSMMGELNFFLRLQIKQMEDGIFFNQFKYIKEMLKKFGLKDSKPMKTPISSDTKLRKDEECESVDSTKYRGMIGVLDVPSDDLEEELSWNSSDDEDVDEQTKGREEKSDEGDDEAIESDRESEDKETREKEEESFDPIPRTPEDNEDDDNNEEDQGLRIGKEERMQEEEDAEELYRLESLFTTGSTTITPIPSPQSTMTPSIISTFTSASQLPTPPTQILSLYLQSLPTFASVFRFEDSVKSLEDNFSNIPGIALVKAYDADKTILDTYGESTILKRRREDDDPEGPSVGSDQGSKRQREEGEHESASTPSKPATGKEPVQPTYQMEEPSHPVFETGADDQPIIQTTQHPEWFSQLRRPPTPDRDWNKYVPAAQGKAQSWINQLDWVNPKGQQCPHNLLQPLPLIPDNRGRSVIPFEHFINNDLEYLRGDTYRSDLKRREAYTAHSNPRGFIYQNKDKKNRLMRIDELYRFSDGTLNDVRNALDDHLKGIRMQYLPTTIWRRGDNARAAAMIQAIDKMLKTRRIMRSLERFVGGRPYEGDFRMQQRTI
nr:retrovirus-related Pol polyprotein from transposon TNT 1-94 [Tanacetum cinerariifolium]